MKHATTFQVGDRVRVRYAYRHAPQEDGQWYRGAVHALVSAQCADDEFNDEITVKLDAGQGRSFVQGRVFVMPNAVEAARRATTIEVEPDDAAVPVRVEDPVRVEVSVPVRER